MPVLRFQMKRDLSFYHLELRNCGVGPANIVSFQRYIDSAPVPEEDLLEYVLKHMELDSQYNVCKNVDGFVLPAGDSITVLKIDHKSNDNLDLSKFFSEHYWAVVGYNSIYKEKELSYEGIN